MTFVLHRAVFGILLLMFGSDQATVLQRLEIHRRLRQCACCHNNADPLSFALENFNVCGEFEAQEEHGYKERIEKNDPLVDASSHPPDGGRINGVQHLQTALLAREDLFLKCLAAC